MSSHPETLWVSDQHKFCEESQQVIFRNGDSVPYEDPCLELKINIYERRIMGWFLDYARELAVNSPSEGDYVAVMIALSQLEGVELFRLGETHGRGSSESNFKSSLSQMIITITENEKAKIYSAVRSGLFHAGFPDDKVYISNDLGDSPVATVDEKTYINPKVFVLETIRFFDDYVTKLRDPENNILRENFEKRWDHLWEKT
jgi:hypothetical protein